MLRTLALSTLIVLAAPAESGEVTTFAYADLLPSLHSVIEFEPLGSDRTRVSISGVGYRDGDGYDQLLDFFRGGNAWTFERLGRRFDEGPLEWNASPSAAASDSTATTNNKGKQ